MFVYRTVSEIFNVENAKTLKSRVVQNYCHYRFISLCKQLVGLCCKLPCPIMIMIMMIENDAVRYTMYDFLSVRRCDIALSCTVFDLFDIE